jgi:hypothetical protein
MEMNTLTTVLCDGKVNIDQQNLQQQQQQQVISSQQ